jgi:hypothetical protein
MGDPDPVRGIAELHRAGRGGGEPQASARLAEKPAFGRVRPIARQSRFGRWELWMDCTQARAARGAQR